MMISILLSKLPRTTSCCQYICQWAHLGHICETRDCLHGVRTLATRFRTFSVTCLSVNYSICTCCWNIFDLDVPIDVYWWCSCSPVLSLNISRTYGDSKEQYKPIVWLSSAVLCMAMLRIASTRYRTTLAKTVDPIYKCTNCTNTKQTLYAYSVTNC